MRPGRLLLAAATSCISACVCAQTTQTLLATPSTVAWGYYSARAKPALTVHSGDTVVMQTASTCGNPQRLMSLGVKQGQIPAWLGPLYDGVPVAACDVDISELVDTNDGVHVMCPKAMFSGPRTPAAK